MALADAEEVIWVVEQLVHIKGEKARTPIRLEPFQKDFIREMLSIVDADAEIPMRQYRRVLFGIARKNAKSTLIAAIAIALLICEREAGMDIIVASGKREQAGIILGIAKGMVKYSKVGGVPLEKFLTVRRDGIYFEELDASMIIISSEGKTAHGLSPSIVLLDELHVFGEEDELLAALGTAQGSRRNPLHISLTTAGPMREGPLWDEYEHLQRIEDDEIEDPQFLGVWYQGADGCDYDDWDEIEAANPGLGTIVYREYIESQLQLVKTGRLNENQFRRLHLNQWTNALENFIPIEFWRACKGETAIEDGTPIVIAMDAAIKRDTFGITWHARQEYLVELEDGSEVAEDVGIVRARYFKADEGKYIDLESVRVFVMGLANLYPVEAVLYDPAYMTLFAQQLAEAGLPMEPFPQSSEKMTRATETLQRMILSDRMRWSDACLNEQLGHTAIKESERGVRISKMDSGQNDTIVCAAMGLDWMFAEELEVQEDFIVLPT